MNTKTALFTVLIVSGIGLNVAGLLQGTLSGLIWAVAPYVLAAPIPHRYFIGKLVFLGVLLAFDSFFWAIVWTDTLPEIVLGASLLTTLKIAPAVLIALIVQVSVGRGTSK